MNKIVNNLTHMDINAQALLTELRRVKPAHHKVKFEGLTAGQRVSDALTRFVGSWPFIIIQGGLLALWIVVNLIGWARAWDPYPFILLNLVLSFQAAFTAPIIMMSQNRQSAIDREKAENDYNVNVKAELEIEQLHERIELLRTQEIQQLIEIIQSLEQKIGAA